MWNNDRYQEVKAKAKHDIEAGNMKPYDYMQKYKRMIEKDDFEGAKAVTEVLKPMNYDTADTHGHIKCLKTKGQSATPSPVKQR